MRDFLKDSPSTYFVKVGVGLRNIDDVALAYNLKLWWRFRCNNSLWSKFMHSKYCSVKHPKEVQDRPGASSVWKHMLIARTHAEPHILWLVGKGDIDAYRDRWCNLNFSMPHDYLKLKACFNPEGLPVENAFESLLSDAAWDDVMS